MCQSSNFLGITNLNQPVIAYSYGILLSITVITLLGVWGVMNNYPSITGFENISPNLIFGAGPYNYKNLVKSSTFPI